MKQETCTLSINDLRIWVSLGCGSQEKFNPQLVSIQINLVFKQLPKGAKTDRIKDTVCYSEIVTDIQKFCQEKQFDLIEYLTNEISKTIIQTLGTKKDSIDIIKITISKVSPPVAGVHGGVALTYCHNPV